MKSPKSYYQTTLQYFSETPKANRKNIGQFFTPEAISNELVGQFASPSSDSISILDAGSGTGVLGLSIAEKLLTHQNSLEITLVFYENNPGILETLRKNCENFILQYPKVSYQIRTEDFLTASIDEEYDYIISNPPYVKVSTKDPIVKPYLDIVKGTTNLYILFMYKCMQLVKSNGQIGVITPASWTTGGYFGGFRGYIFNNYCIDSIVNFKERNNVFDQKDKVLQKTMITLFSKGTQKQHINYKIISREGDIKSEIVSKVKSELIINKRHSKVVLVDDLVQFNAIERIEEGEYTLKDFGLRFGIGKVLPFRHNEWLSEQDKDAGVTVVGSSGVSKGCYETKLYLDQTKTSLMNLNNNKLILRRFAFAESDEYFNIRVYSKNELPGKYIALQDNLTYIEGINGDCDINALNKIKELLESKDYVTYIKALNATTSLPSELINNLPFPRI